MKYGEGRLPQDRYLTVASTPTLHSQGFFYLFIFLHPVPNPEETRRKSTLVINLH